jgi:hypothetical protein
MLAHLPVLPPHVALQVALQVVLPFQDLLAYEAYHHFFLRFFYRSFDNGKSFVNIMSAKEESRSLS